MTQYKLTVVIARCKLRQATFDQHLLETPRGLLDLPSLHLLVGPRSTAAATVVIAVVYGTLAAVAHCDCLLVPLSTRKFGLRACD